MAENSTSSEQLRRALDAIRQLKQRVAEAEATGQDPIAIVGLGLRFPGGVTTPSALWKLLKTATDATSEVPANRWDVEAFYDPDPDASGKISTRRGGFIDEIENFDPQHFGLAPAEAPHMDPQQRLLLETSWEALENAAIAPDLLAEKPVGVFIGISSADYAQRLFANGMDQIDPYVGSGNAHSIAAGRIAYSLGLSGPAIAVDTACSSSLVSVHLACQSLRSRECDLALSGGVSLQLSPIISVNHSRARMLSPDGRCKAFGDQADGFGRSDGCGVVVLKRLAQAEQDGDRILAVIRGSATNQDGRTSGLTVPNGGAQQAVIQKALQQANLTPADIDYVEAHGTGTALGDPIEANALGAVFHSRPPEKPLLLGSIKSNLGHCEAAAGVAGLIKVVMALQAEAIPPHLHADPPSTRIAWDELPLRIVNQSQAWPHSTERPRVAGVSSFGFGGTNAHVIVSEAPARETAETTSADPADLLPLSARSPTALARIAQQLHDQMPAGDSRNWNDMAFTLAVGRSSFPFRALVSDSNSAEALSALASGKHSVAETRHSPRIAFMFSGQGSLTAHAGMELFSTVPEFRSAFENAAKIVQQHAGWNPIEVIADPDKISRTQYGQVGLFCLSYALAETWHAWGVHPDVVLGHSVGEYAAACVAGALPLDDALRLLILRAQKMGELGETGAMVAVSAAVEGLEAKIAAAGAEIGALNAPRQFVLTGSRDHVTKCAAQFSADGIPTVALKVNQGYHSAEMEPMLPSFAEAAAAIEFRSPQCDFISSVTGQVIQAELQSSKYWTNQIRQPVRWSAAIETLRSQKVDLIIEVGPRGLLTALSQHTWSAAGPAWVPSLPSQIHGLESAAFKQAAAQAWLHGASLDWRALYRGQKRQRLALPTYPFERQRYWAISSPTAATAYRLVDTVVSTDSQTEPSSPSLTGKWHLIGNLPALADLLRDKSSDRVPHGAEASPLDLQPYLADIDVAHRGIISSDHPLLPQWIGAAKVWALEYPENWDGLIVTGNESTAQNVIDALATTRTAAVVHVNGTDTTSPQLQSDSLPPATWKAQPDVTYLITGGLGALGLQLANWLSNCGAKSIHLLSRRPPSDVIASQLSDLRERGVDLTISAVDVTNRDSLKSAIDSSVPPVGGVFHAAGAAGFEKFSTLNPTTWQQVISAKVAGSRNLHELTADLDLHAFVMFSSIASVWGSQGQAHYAAANQFLDDLIQSRRTQGLPGLTINWGPWAGGGMADDEVATQLAAIGVGQLSPTAALNALGSALTGDRSQVVVANINWERFREVYEIRGETHLLAKMPKAAKPTEIAPNPDNASILATKLKESDPDDRQAVALDHVMHVLSEVLKLPATTSVSPQTGFADLGVDSLMAINLRRKLAQNLGGELAATVVFDYPDGERLAHHLIERYHALHQTEPSPATDSSTPAESDAAAELERKLGQLGF